MSSMDKVRFRVTITTPLGKSEKEICQDKFSVGRGSACAVSIANATGVSRTHLLVYSLDGQVWIKDLGSRFGTHVNGHRIASNVPLLYQPGQTLKVGPDETYLQIEALNDDETKYDIAPMEEFPPEIVSKPLGDDVVGDPAPPEKPPTSLGKPLGDDVVNDPAARKEPPASLMEKVVQKISNIGSSDQENEGLDGLPMSSSYHEAQLLLSEANQKAKEIETEAAAYKFRLEKDIAALMKERNHLDDENKRRRENIDKLRDEGSKVESDNHAILTRHHLALQKTAKEYGDLRAKKQEVIKEREQLVSGHQGEIDRLGELSLTMQEKHDRLTRDNDELQTEYDALRTSFTELKHVLEKTSRELKADELQTRTDLRAQQKQLEAIQSKNQSAREELGIHKQNLKDAKLEVKNIYRTAKSNAASIEKQAQARSKQIILETQEKALAHFHKTKTEADRILSEANQKSEDIEQVGKEYAERLANEMKARVQLECEQMKDSLRQDADNTVSTAKVRSSELILQAGKTGEQIEHRAKENAGAIVSVDGERFGDHSHIFGNQFEPHSR